MCITTTTPYRFNIGDKVKIIGPGKYSGLVGIVKKRLRVDKTDTPVPVSENCYNIVLGNHSNTVRFTESSLEPV